MIFFLSIFNIFKRPFCILGQVIVRIIYLFSWSPFQVYPLSDPKSKSCLWSLFVVAALICGAYFIGSAFVAKDYEDVLSSTQSPLFKFTSYKDVMLICQSELNCMRVYSVFEEFKCWMEHLKITIGKVVGKNYCWKVFF